MSAAEVSFPRCTSSMRVLSWSVLMPAMLASRVPTA